MKFGDSEYIFTKLSRLEVCRFFQYFNIVINYKLIVIGEQLVSTFAFLQAVATKSFIVYSLHGGITKEAFIRIEKYSKRGFTLLEPSTFDGNFTLIMKKPSIPLYRVQHRNFIDDDGEIQTETVEYWRQPARNIDTFDIQERFIAAL